MCGWFYPDDPRSYDDEELRDLADANDDPVPTHECRRCRDYVTYIESSPTKDWHWCPECEGVQRFVRIDRLSE